MQPLVSPVDHESRRHSVQAEVVTENTPLLNRFPHRTHDSNINILVIVSLLLTILIAGIVIGTYLLIIQSDSENIVPPVEAPLQLVSRSQWDTGLQPRNLTHSHFEAQVVVVVQTDTEQCYTTSSCITILNDMKRVNDSMQPLPYNFLISSKGTVFEALGWRTPSPLFQEYGDTALVLAFIGNYTDNPVTRIQLQGAKTFFAESVSQQHLKPFYRIIVKNSKFHPTHLFGSMSKLNNCDVVLSDKEK